MLDLANTGPRNSKELDPELAYLFKLLSLYLGIWQKYKKLRYHWKETKLDYNAQIYSSIAVEVLIGR